MQKSTIQPMGVRSLYPIEFNKNNPSLEGFDEWRQYIKDEVRKNEGVSTMMCGALSIVVMPVERLDALIRMESMRLQAEAVLEGRRSS